MAAIGICTIEKSNKVLNQYCLESTMNRLGIVVFDEFHMVQDLARGPTLEMAVAKILCWNKFSRQLKTSPRVAMEAESAFKSQHRVQLVGMSATFSNMPKLCRWLHAASYVSTFRPVELAHFVVAGGCAFRLDPNRSQKMSSR